MLVWVEAPQGSSRGQILDQLKLVSKPLLMPELEGRSPRTNFRQVLVVEEAPKLLPDLEASQEASESRRTPSTTLSSMIGMALKETTGEAAKSFQKSPSSKLTLATL